MTLTSLVGTIHECANIWSTYSTRNSVRLAAMNKIDSPLRLGLHWRAVSLPRPLPLNTGITSHLDLLIYRYCMDTSLPFFAISCLVLPVSCHSLPLIAGLSPFLASSCRSLADSRKLPTCQNSGQALQFSPIMMLELATQSQSNPIDSNLSRPQPTRGEGAPNAVRSKEFCLGGGIVARESTDGFPDGGLSKERSFGIHSRPAAANRIPALTQNSTPSALASKQVY